MLETVVPSCFPGIPCFCDFCRVWLFSVLPGRLQVARGGVKLRPRSSLEVRGSPELQNGGVRALGEAWMMTSRLRHFSVKFGRFCASEGVGGSRSEAGGSRVEAGSSELKAGSSGSEA